MYDIIALILLIVALLLIFYIIYLKREIDFRAEKRFNEMKDQLSKQVLGQSRATLKGKISEQVVPFLEQFKYNPADARFIGSPIDYVIFDGYTEVKDSNVDRPITVVLADVKSGKSRALTQAQRKIRQAVEENRVKWETINL